MSLVDIHNRISSADQQLEKQAEAEMQKWAEEDAAGRIMARGFMDELNKLAQGWPSGASHPAEAKAGTVPSKPGFTFKMPKGGAGPGLGSSMVSRNLSPGGPRMARAPQAPAMKFTSPTYTASRGK